jgi:hypothetical protein
VQNEAEYPAFWLKPGRLFDENDIGVTISSRLQFAVEFCGGLFSASLTQLPFNHDIVH